MQLATAAVLQGLLAGLAAWEVDAAFARAAYDEIVRTIAEPGPPGTDQRQTARRTVAAIRTMAEQFAANPGLQGPGVGSG